MNAAAVSRGAAALLLFLAGCASEGTTEAAAASNEFREVAPNGDRAAIFYGADADGVAFYRLAEQNRGATTVWRLPSPPQSGEFRLYLAANPTTGYQWECDIVSAEKGSLKLLEQRFLPPETTDPPLCGAPGESCFRFELEPKWKSAELRLRRRRRWEPVEKSAAVWRLRLTPTP